MKLPLFITYFSSTPWDDEATEVHRQAEAFPWWYLNGNNFFNGS